MSLLAALNLEKQNRCISVCGSGGKSSLCRALALELAGKDRSTVITTTTHIAFPRFAGAKTFLSNDREELRRLLRTPGILIAGRGEGQKLCFGGDEQLKLLLEEAETVIIEADGSKMLPLKYPNETEPVIPKETDAVIVVCGLSAWGKPLEEVCHRFPLAKAALPELGSAADADAIASILWNGYKRYDPLFILNQADTSALKEAGNEIKQRLKCLGTEQVSIISLKEMGFAEQYYF